METGIPHMGTLLSASPFPYGDPHLKTGNPNGNVFSFEDFFLNPQMVTDTVWKRVSDWTVPEWKQGCVNPLFPYGDPHVEMGSRIFLFPIWKRRLTISNAA